MRTPHYHEDRGLMDPRGVGAAAPATQDSGIAYTKLSTTTRYRNIQLIVILLSVHSNIIHNTRTQSMFTNSDSQELQCQHTFNLLITLKFFLVRETEMFATSYPNKTHYRKHLITICRLTVMSLTTLCIPWFGIFINFLLIPR